MESPLYLKNLSYELNLFIVVYFGKLVYDIYCIMFINLLFVDVALEARTLESF